MRQAGPWIVAGFLAALTGAATAAPRLPAPIIPSEAIGPFRLGMTPGQISAARRTAPCDVRVTFVADRASRLETNCGGAYFTAERIQVGGDPGRVSAVFGAPDRVANSDFWGARADWFYYFGHGIAFRVIYGLFGSGFVQAIAVFPRRGPIPSPVPAPAPSPAGPETPPGVGD